MDGEQRHVVYFYTRLNSRYGYSIASPFVISGSPEATSVVGGSPMSFLSAAFFTWVQGAPFYVDVHSQAVALLPSGNGKTWLDVGCGPGLVARLACDRGYEVLGIDRDPEMVRLAKRKTRGDPRCRFDVGDINDLSGRHSADVVSAASLLFVLPDPDAAIQQLWDCVRPGGKLLVIETTERMTVDQARTVKKAIPHGRRFVLNLWARARNGRAVPNEIFLSVPARIRDCIPLLNGLVNAGIFEKEVP